VLPTALMKVEKKEFIRMASVLSAGNGVKWHNGEWRSINKAQGAVRAETKNSIQT
jgi:hypothetical protein